MRCTISTLHCLMNSFSVLFNVQHQAENLGASLSFLSTVDKEAVAEPAAHTKINSPQHTHSRGSPGTGKKGDRVKSGPGGEERGEEEGHRSKYGQLFFFLFLLFLSIQLIARSQVSLWYLRQMQVGLHKLLLKSHNCYFHISKKKKNHNQREITQKIFTFKACFKGGRIRKGKNILHRGKQ